jgi:2'-5' RNA ligase
VRLFVALELPSEVREALADWGATLPGLRALAMPSLHVTLCFLGERPDEQVVPITSALRSAPAPLPGPLTVDPEPLVLPRGRPRAVAVRLREQEGRLVALQAGIVRTLAERGIYSPERRAFLPHVTVARVPRGGRVSAARLAAVPSVAAFAADHVTLFRSHPGSVYEPLARLVLTGAA